MMLFKKIILVFLSCIVLTAQAQEKRHFLGVLEEVATSSTFNKETNKEDYTYTRVMRMLFEKEGNEWISPWGNAKAYGENAERYLEHKNIPTEINWTIAFDGKNLGEVTSKKLTPCGYPEGTLMLYIYPVSQEIISKSPIPSIGKRPDPKLYGSDAVLRPLVANSMPYYRDPDGWKPAELSASNINLFREAFRKKFPEIGNCPIKREDDIRKPWLYKDKDIKIRKSYSSNKGWLIAELHLVDQCGEPFAGPAFDGAWFVVTPGHEIKILREKLWSHGNDEKDERMELVDAGDYDNSGRSQLLFAFNGLRRYGYVLFYDGFDKHVEVTGSTGG